MSTLLLFLPPRTRLRALGKAAPAAAELPRADAVREYDYALTPDGRQITAEGRAAPGGLPAADSVIAIVAESDVSWRRVDLPRAGRQMRAALAGKLEEALLDDPDTLHFALEPDALGGDTAWVAITSRPWLAEHLAQLEAAQIFIDRVAPLSWPDELARGHFFEANGAGTALRWSHTEGVATLALEGGLARQFFPPGLVHAAQWTATPGAATAAERWLGTAVTVQTPAQRALAVVDSAWNLRQFDLAPRARGTRALRLFSRGLMRKPWQPVRQGLVGLALVQLLGINLWAWHQQREVAARREAITTTLTGAFPQVRAILDAPVQMQKQLDLLRASAGSVGEQDLEALLAAAALAWPADRPPTEALAFEPGRLTVSAQGWAQPQIDNFRNQLRSEGWQLDASEGKLTISRASAQGRP
ncbi:general secretion pathway protein L [Pelomonas saccharophila]|uniref:General secretion pathway protein L n=1 Tax=Roseateles saccharophilus TaxID=304 RepID=A0ABU1YJM0_ROSSA|nr:type II secretion system protein GspL [Roseateles saccharophilus]MDR7269049.1 general secretion pathway protein L [Roseateles saccharophilus]